MSLAGRSPRPMPCEGERTATAELPADDSASRRRASATRPHASTRRSTWMSNSPCSASASSAPARA
eukprot:15277534-Alexandrium_andersonii.AAC.1